MISARQVTVTASAFVAMFVIFGVAYSFGAFFEAMGEELGSNAARTSAVFSITTFLFFLLGAVTGRISDRLGARPLLVLAALSLAGGLFATARVTTVEAGYLSYGLGVGLAVAAAYVPSVATVGKWFEERRAAALGIAVTGIGVGTMVVAPVAASLIEAVGWRDAYRTMGWVGGAVLLLAAAGIGAKHADPDATPAHFGPRALADRRARMLYLAALAFSVALFVPFVFAPAYARSRGADPVAAAFLLGLLGLGSTAARLVLGPLANRFGSLRLFRWCFLLHTASYLIWLGAGESYAAMATFVVVMGFAYGGFVALSSAVIADAYGPAVLGAALGALYTAAAVGSLAGPPAAGAVLDLSGSYTTVVTGLVVVSGIGTLLLLLGVPMDARGRIERLPL